MGAGSVQGASNRYDAIIVGAGHNGLVTAGYLARAGWKTLVLERRHIVGGACVTEEVIPGYRMSTAAYLVSLLNDDVVRDLRLESYGYEVMPKEPAYFAPYPDGRYLLMWQDQRRTCDEISKFSQKDAERYPEYEKYIGNIATVSEELMRPVPPNLPPAELRDWAILSRLGWRLLRLSRQEAYAIWQMLVQSAGELLDRWFESDQLKVALATDGVIGANAGPYSPGTAYVLLHHVMGGVGGVRGLWGFVKGGMGGLTQAMARSAIALGAEIRTSAPVGRILVEDGRAVGVQLEDGASIRGRVVVSNADPKRTFLTLIDQRQLDSAFRQHITRYKCEGVSFKLNLALSRLPSYSALPGHEPGPQHKGTTHICPTLADLERAWDDAKYGRPSRSPLLEIVIPTAYEPELAPAGHHVMSIFAQYTPYRLRDGDWSSEKPRLIERIIDLVSEYAPGFADSVVGAHGLSPADLEEQFGLTGGNIFHGEMSLDQLYSFRPAPGYARYATPIKNLYLCGAGTHPGGGVIGVAGRNAAFEVLRSHRRM